MKFDEFLFSTLGEIGKYQKIQFALLCLPTTFVVIHALSWTFAAIPVPYRCLLPGETPESLYKTDIYNFTKCTRNEEPISLENAGQSGVECFYSNIECEIDGKTCNDYVYSHETVKYSAIEKWDIVCSNSWIKATVQALYYVGQMGGSMTFGILGDKIGRKKVFFIAIMMQLVCALALSIAPTWYIYAFLRTCVGFAHPGIFVVAVVIATELVGPEYRKLASIIFNGFAALGQILLGLEAWLVTDFRLLHLVIEAPVVVFISYWWLIPESVRWLVAQKRYPEADVILRKAAKTNGVELPEKWWQDVDQSEENSEKEQQKYGILDLFRTPELRKRTFVVFYLWPVVSMVYYGMAMKANVLGGDIYLNFVFAAAVELPALVIVYLTLDRLGRRLVTAVGFFVAGAMLIVNWLMGDNVSSIVAIIQMLLTKGSITLSYVAIYTYAAELFPTVIRNTALGCCSTIARVGAVSASYVAMWIVESYGKVYMIIPFGIMSVSAGILTLLFLPETMGQPLPETINQVKRIHPSVNNSIESDLLLSSKTSTPEKSSKTD